MFLVLLGHGVCAFLVWWIATRSKTPNVDDGTGERGEP
jgi:hypothetical protein